jgi:hypothetical protein
VLGLDRDCYLSIVKILDSSRVRKVWLNTLVLFSFYFFFDSTLELVKNLLIEWNTSILSFTDWKVLLLLFCYYIFFSDGSLPLSKLTIPNPHGKFKLEGRNIIFQGYTRSLILKEGISDGILEVFVLC